MTETRTLGDEDIRTVWAQQDSTTAPRAGADDDDDDTDVGDDTDTTDTGDTSDTDDDGDDA